MIDLAYSLVIEATEEPDYFVFYSPELLGFRGVGNSIQDCISLSRWGMADYVKTLQEQGLPVPPQNPDPRITIRNEEPITGS